MDPNPVRLWHHAIETNDLGGFEAALAEDAVFQSPAVHAPQAGKALVAKYLRAAFVVLNNPTFRYVEEWHGDGSAVLEFEVMLGDIHVNGVDIIRWNRDGQVVSFKVMVRPIKALNTLVALMGAALERHKS